MRLNNLEERGFAASNVPPASLSSTTAALAMTSRSSQLAHDDAAIVHINEAYVFVGWKKSSIRNRLNEKSPYFDPEFPKPIDDLGKKSYFYRRELVAYPRRKAGSAASFAIAVTKGGNK